MLHSFSFWYFLHNGFDTPWAVFEVLQFIQVLLMMLYLMWVTAGQDSSVCVESFLFGITWEGCFPSRLFVFLVVNVFVLVWPLVSFGLSQQTYHLHPQMRCAGSIDEELRESESGTDLER